MFREDVTVDENSIFLVRLYSGKKVRKSVLTTTLSIRPQTMQPKVFGIYRLDIFVVANCLEVCRGEYLMTERMRSGNVPSLSTIGTKRSKPTSGAEAVSERDKVAS